MSKVMFERLNPLLFVRSDKAIKGPNSKLHEETLMFVKKPPTSE